MKRHILGTLPLVLVLLLGAWMLRPSQADQPPFAMVSTNCAKSPDFGAMLMCFDSTLGSANAYYSTGGNFAPVRIGEYKDGLFGSLPSCAAGTAGWQVHITDSTTVSAEGQSCVGSSTHDAIAICNGAGWVCF